MGVKCQHKSLKLLDMCYEAVVFHETRTIFLLFRFKEPNHLTFDKTRPFKSDLFSLSLISEAEPFEQITTSGDKLLLFTDNHYCISPSWITHYREAFAKNEKGSCERFYLTFSKMGWLTTFLALKTRWWWWYSVFVKVNTKGF